MAFHRSHMNHKSDGWLADLQADSNTSPFATYTSAAESSGNQRRAELIRRSTMASTTMPAISPYAHWQAAPMPMDRDLSNATQHKIHRLDQKRNEIDAMRDQRQKFDAEMLRIERQHQKDAKEIADMTAALNSQIAAGKKSEPTTPGEQRESSGFATAFSRTNRYSASAIMPPPGLPPLAAPTPIAGKRVSQPSILTEPSFVPAKIASKSVPGSRRNSDENDSDLPYVEEALHLRSVGAHNRNSMPAVGPRPMVDHDAEASASLGFGQINTARFLFGDEESERSTSRRDHRDSSSDVKSYLQMNATEDKFPILVRRDDRPGLLSASSAALDLASPDAAAYQPSAGTWSSAGHHRPSQLSLPSNTFLPSPASAGDDDEYEDDEEDANEAGPSHAIKPANISPARRVRFERTLTDVQGHAYSQSAQSMPTGVELDNNTAHGAVPPKLQSSYSANDILTMRNTRENAGIMGLAATNDAHQVLSQSNSLAHGGASNPTATSGRNINTEDQVATRPVGRRRSQRRQAALPNHQAPFGPMPTQMPIPPWGFPPFGYPGFYNGYGMPMMGPQMSGMPMGHPMYPMPRPFFPPQMPGSFGQAVEVRPRTTQNRRGNGNGNGNGSGNGRNAGEASSGRFVNAKLESLVGEIYPLCKDQHGCRYLQQKLDERKESSITLIFDEVKDHMSELMTDPFGNYLCQKLLEYTDDEQRTTLVNNAAPDLANVALNQHGTRALQKMIECISAPEQITTVTVSLTERVVELVQDVNGNHVIQKCLNRLTSVNSSFIFDAVSANCVAIGTHRHGCCVLQRCVDHATGLQKAELVRQICSNMFSLVKDPFGNYVVQYILDIGDSNYVETLATKLTGEIAILSKHKFSSNVVEKMIRSARPDTRRRLIFELLNPTELPKLVRDSYANYVIQTALEWADPDTKTYMISAIQPFMQSIRSTPFGRRIAGKINAIENRSGPSSGVATPAEGVAPGNSPPAAALPPARSATPSKGPKQSTLNPLAGSFGPMKKASKGPAESVWTNGAKSEQKNTTTQKPKKEAQSKPDARSVGSSPVNGKSASSQASESHEQQPQHATPKKTAVPNFSRPGNHGGNRKRNNNKNSKKGAKGAEGASGSKPT